MALSIENVKGLNTSEQDLLNELVYIFNSHKSANETKNRYYEGHIQLADVNLGIALPDNISKLEIGCEWATKAVDVLASRSMFDGFVGANGDDASAIYQIAKANNLVTEYQKTVKDELKLGSAFCTLSKDAEIGCKIRFHSGETSAARYNGSKGRIDAGIAIIDSRKDNNDKVYRPALINMYTDNKIYVISKSIDGQWSAISYDNPMGRPLMEPLTWNATSGKPFGRSRIKSTIRHLCEGYIRTIANATIGLEFATTPQKYLLGVTDEQYDILINQKFKQYVGSILAATINPETGQAPSFGQLAQGNIQPHIEMMRLLSTQFSAASGLTVTDVGVVNDANPTSSDAILAQSQTLVRLAENLNAVNRDSLNTIACMAQAIARNCRYTDLTEEEKNVVAHFKNPAMPSVSVTADAAIKIASSRQGFANTDVFLEMVGFDQADIRRIKAQEQRARGQEILLEEFNNANNK